ncbi:hypothetical protein [Flavisolibacter tropicus]|uniref:Uncharacterized protein n=1 Tax=Flavisolibacter tropicus TaxID=1492898 RepID=A0A172TY85_9BACT|nr:hypothetical protein [Flavisolibacter tropicus]ANE52071.1 hypothetical protein SY85_17805 [Flavisolibacter tropicus]
MDLNEILPKSENIQHFIDEQMLPCSYDRIELVKSSHSLSIENFNRKLKEIRPYTLGEFLINDIYAYRPSTTSYCLYLLLDLSSRFIDSLILLFGSPFNVTMEDVEKRDFDFLHWEINDIDITLRRDHGGNYTSRTKKKVILSFTNMHLDDLLNKEKIFGL